MWVGILQFKFIFSENRRVQQYWDEIKVFILRKCMQSCISIHLKHTWKFSNGTEGKHEKRLYKYDTICSESVRTKCSFISCLLKKYFSLYWTIRETPTGIASWKALTSQNLYFFPLKLCRMNMIAQACFLLDRRLQFSPDCLFHIYFYYKGTQTVQIFPFLTSS